MNNQPLRLMMLLQGLNVGGLEKMTVDLANNLPDSYESVLCCYDTLGPLTDLLKKECKPILLKRRQGFDTGFIFKLKQALKEMKIDVLHAHNHTAFFYGTIAAWMAKTPRIVFTEHGRTDKLSWKARMAHRFISRWVHQTVVVADYLKDKLIREEGFPPDRIRYIPNGIDDSPYKDGSKDRSLIDELNLAPESKLVGIIARLDPIKNHKLFLDAMKDVLLEVPEAKALLVGAGPLESELKQRAASESLLKEAVVFLGERTDVPRILKNLDLFVLPSLSEGMSLTLVEAMAAGLPIVATAVGGNPKIIESGESGLLVPSNEPRALSEAIIKLLKNRDLSKNLAEKARQRYRSEFTLEKMVSQYRAIYEASTP